LAARNRRNLKTGEAVKTPAYVLPRFLAGTKLKDACNKKNKEVAKK